MSHRKRASWERENLTSHGMDDAREELAFHKSQFSGKNDIFPSSSYGEDELMDEEEGPIPWKSIIYAAFLFLLGSILLICGALVYTGFIAVADSYGSSIPLLVVGCLLFIPGFHFTRIAYLSYRQVPGFDYDQIPEF